MGWADDIPAGLPPLEQAARERRRSLLAALPLEDLDGRRRVELGTGEGEWRDGALAAADATADVFDARDGLDRIADTERLLDEIHRVLRPGGQLVAVVTNADAHLFAGTATRHGVSGDRPGLMGHRELRAMLEPRFELLAARGYNGAVHPDLDARVTEMDFARAWAAQLADRPDLATHSVLLARPRSGWRPGRTRTRVVGPDDPAITWRGPWAPAELAPGVAGRIGTGGDDSVLELDVEGTDLLLLFWSHPWSGQATIEVDGVARPIDLYSAASGFRRIHVDGLCPGPHRVYVRGSAARNPRSAGRQVIFQQAIAYDDPTARPSAATEYDMDASFQTRPGRFGVIYTTPAHMTASERVLLYGLTFGLRPARTLEIGTFRGGSALVICAALDDIGEGRLVCVDPVPQVAPEHWAQVSHRATLFAEPSPDALPRAMEAAGGPFDFALIDGDHELPGVVRDIEGVLPVLAPDAHLLFHDAHYWEVQDAIDRMLAVHADTLSDCGMVSTERTPEDRSVNGRQIVWGGLRLLRYRRPR